MYYQEDRKGADMEEGINEAAMASSWIAAATLQQSWDVWSLYIYY